MRIISTLAAFTLITYQLTTFANEDIEASLLSHIPNNDSVSYSSLRINDKTRRLLESCSFTEINFQINDNRPSTSIFKTKCQDGREISFSAKLDGKTKSLVAKRSIKRKTRLNKGNFELDWVPLGEINGITFKSFVEDNYYQASRNLRKGQPISLKNVNVAPVIERGWNVKARAVVSNMTITIDVIALDDGASGETIKVENSISNKIFYAKVLNSSTVIIK